MTSRCKMRRSTSKSHVGTSVSEKLTGSSLTQADLANRLNMSPSYVNQVMTGKKSSSPRWLDLVADVLNLNEQDRERLHYAGARDAGFKLDLTTPKKAGGG